MSHILRNASVIPVVEIEDASKAVPLCEALLRAGVNAVEITLRTAEAMPAIKQIKAAALNMVLGVGTIIRPDDVAKAEDSGADFLVSPGLSPALRTRLVDSSLLVLPGVATPSEAMAAYEAGFDKLKLFPAAVLGGVAMLKAMGGPMPHIKFMPTGGVHINNMQDYLCLPNVYAVGGSWIATRDDINSAAWTDIETKARRAIATANNVSCVRSRRKT